MSRFAMLIVLAAVAPCPDADAQWFWGSKHRSKNYRSSLPRAGEYRSQYGAPSGLSLGVSRYSGFGYRGYGYLDPYRFDGFGYDPYRHGSFEAPDLLKDTYFRERHRYDSHFPGRYPPSRTYPPPRRVIIHAPAVDTYYGHSVLEPRGGGTEYIQPDFGGERPRIGEEVPLDPADVQGHLRVACKRLHAGLLLRSNGHLWVAYLKPLELARLVEEGELSQPGDWLRHYDGVVANEELRSVQSVDGFESIRTLLRHLTNELKADESPQDGDSLQGDVLPQGTGEREEPMELLPPPVATPEPESI